MPELYETAAQEIPVKAVLITVDTGEFDAELSLKELEELAHTAGAEVVGQVMQKRPSPDTATYIGSGRLAELTAELEALGADLLIFDCELTANQTRNIENITDVRAIDRTTLILDIFAQRALSAEGRIQVELAQQKYRLAHLAGKGVSMSRLGGGIGTRGPGESKLETDRRHIRRRIELLEDDLKEIRRRRDLIRKRRKKDSVLTAAVVGYTNVGKSTLLNALTDAGVLAENKLFATLDITSRSIELPDGRSVLLTDTVGLIRRLPHHLVEAFKSTLEEAANADIILNVIDISSDDAYGQAQVTNELLSELGCDDIPKINVLNKCDKLPGWENIPEDSTTVKISAKEQTGFDRLLEVIAANLPEQAVRGSFVIPYDKGSLLNTIRADGKIFSEEYTEKGTLIDALVDKKVYYLVEEYRCEQ
ncbi:MAG: GTPase HflX [Oscillospiraceae bacterium]|nr:GTPase HflX [Oscillospiraceae bacterium]MDD7278002.1 GTPase HflX [Oscillospiraceae bacterium]MDY2862897.1 GTPase HflX [Oscillospiraceae bacterium]